MEDILDPHSDDEEADVTKETKTALKNLNYWRQKLGGWKDQKCLSKKERKSAY